MFVDDGDDDPENYVGNPSNCKLIKVKIKEFISSKGQDLYLSQIKICFLYLVIFIEVYNIILILNE